MANATKKNTKAELEGLRLPELQGRFREVVGEMTRSPNRKFLVRRIEQTLAAEKTEAETSTQPSPAEPEPQPQTSALPSPAEPEPAATEAANTEAEQPPTETAEAEPAATEPANTEAEEPQAEDAHDEPAATKPAITETEQPQADTAIAEPTPTEPAGTEPAITAVEQPQTEDAHDDACLGCPLCLPAEPPTATAQAKPARGRFSGMSVQQLQAKYLEVVGRPTGSDNTAYLIWKIREAEKGRITVGPVQPRKPEGTTSDADVMVLPLRLRTQVVTAMDAAWKANSIKSRMDFLRRAIGHYLVRLGADDAAALFTESK